MSTGTKWHQRRKIITPSFHFKILEHFTEIMDHQGQVFISNLKSSDGKQVDIFPLVSLYALDVICGKNFDLCENKFHCRKMFQNRRWDAK